MSNASVNFTLLRNVICVQLYSLQLCFVKTAGGVRGLAMRKVQPSKDNSTRFVTKKVRGQLLHSKSASADSRALPRANETLRRAITFSSSSAKRRENPTRVPKAAHT